MNIWCAPIKEKCSCGSKETTYSYGVYVRTRYQRRGEFCVSCFHSRSRWTNYPPIEFCARSGHSLSSWVKMSEKRAA